MKHARKRLIVTLLLCTFLLTGTAWRFQISPQSTPESTGGTGHYLYVATPGIRDYLGYGGH